jgi:translocation and assembly module TamB
MEKPAGNIKPHKRRWKRVFNFLGKVLLGLIILFIILIFLLQSSIIQHRIASRITSYLSASTNGTVTMDDLNFSLLGNLSIKGLRVLDPDSNLVLSAGIVGVKTNIFDILSGDYLFDELRLEDVKANLSEGKEGLNINYIIKAFAPKAPPVEDTTAPDVVLQFKKVFLRNIEFQFLSDESGTDLKVKIADLTGEHASFNTNGNIIGADNMLMEQSNIDILMKQMQDTIINTTEPIKPGFIPDFGMGLGFNIKELMIKDSHFASHQDTILITSKFDPRHLSFDDIQIHITDAKMNPDTLQATLHEMQVKLPGFNVERSAARLQMTRQQLSVADLQVYSGTDEITANINAAYTPSNTHSAEPNSTFSTKAKITPGHLAYFLPDDLMHQLQNWSITTLIVDGQNVAGKTNLDTLSLITSNSHINAYGQLSDITNADKISWHDLSVRASLGEDFKQLLAPYFGDLKIPPSVQIQMLSTGNQDDMFIDGKVITTWGTATAKGNVVLTGDDVDLDMKVSGENLYLYHWIKQDWLGPINASAHVKGKLGTHQDAHITGQISSVELLDKNISNITFQSYIQDENIAAEYIVHDSRYGLQGKSNIAFEKSMIISNQLQFDSFQMGQLMELDSSFALTGNLAADITIDGDTIKGTAISDRLLFKNQYTDYALDTFSVTALLSPSASHLEYLTDDGKGYLTANFDIQEAQAWLEPWMKNVLSPNTQVTLPDGDRKLEFNLHFNKPALLHLAGMEVENFTSMDAMGSVNEKDHKADIQFHSGKFEGYGLAYDTLRADLALSGDSLGGKVNGNHIVYKTYDLGNLNFNMKTKRDTMLTDLTLSRDSSAYIDLGTRILRQEDGAFIYPTRLVAFNKEYQFDPHNGIWVNDSNVVVKNFVITSDSMHLDVNGDLHAFQADFQKLDLTLINPLISTDEQVINKGYLHGNIVYATDKQLELEAKIDSLILYHSFPVTVTMKAVKDQNHVPFEFLLANSTNTVDIQGTYFYDEETMDASMKMNVTNPEMFAFLYSDYLAEMKGNIRGHASIHGNVSKPEIQGNLLFHDLTFTTLDPRLTFFIKEDSIRLDNTGLKLDQFTLYDKEQHPLIISGHLNTSKFPSYNYDFNIKADNYDLINNPDTVKGPIKGLLVIDTDVNLKGNEKDTDVDADVKIRGNTKITYVMANTDDAILNTTGIVEFVDPGQLIDTSKANTTTMYDSIVAGLPDFNFHADLTIDNEATLRVITDEQSGDYFEATGGTGDKKLEMGYDRTGNPHISGVYTIKQGKYRVSFYDLVKKTFILVPGSTINWSGSPESGEMDIKANYTVATNSLGLIGHEIGENEKSTYKRSLDYIVGISIKGTLERPVINFTLDISEYNRSNYPVLANKLDRLKQPEFQSELNKQVFGLLVMGGFLPETSAADIDQTQVATTAIYNSVNALLATQLNRFASQYVKGVNIDVGIQSYADYSTPGGKTTTAMDFRVSKSVFNNRLSFEVGGDFDINSDQSGANTGNNYRGDAAIIYDLTGNGDKQLKLFNNESYDIIYQEIRNTGISLIFIREFDKGEKGGRAEDRKGKKGKGKRNKQ